MIRKLHLLALAFSLGSANLTAAPKALPSETKIWQAFGKKDWATVETLVNQVIAGWGESARKTNASLTSLPSAKEARKYGKLNRVAIGLYLKGEALLKKGDKRGALEAYINLSEKFEYENSHFGSLHDLAHPGVRPCVYMSLHPCAHVSTLLSSRATSHYGSSASVDLICVHALLRIGTKQCFSPTVPAGVLLTHQFCKGFSGSKVTWPASTHALAQLPQRRWWRRRWRQQGAGAS